MSAQGIDALDIGQHVHRKLSGYKTRIHKPSLVLEGRLKRVVGHAIEVEGCSVPIGGYCRIERGDGDFLDAEVVGFSGENLMLMPVGEIKGLAPNSRVFPQSDTYHVRVGENLMGRVIDGSGKPLDGMPVTGNIVDLPLAHQPTNSFLRKRIGEPFDTGIRVINALTTVGVGQRIGLFAPSGVGKSVLLGMIARFSHADVIIISLVGERSREVREFIEDNLGPEGMKRSTVVVSPADAPPLQRIHSAMVATSLAETHRKAGRKVLLLMDSITRVAESYREVALAAGEPPAARGYPPSVFSIVPKLLERAGNGTEQEGSVTAIYTVLTEEIDGDDPVVESIKAVLDGHIVLTRSLAESGIYPAIDLERSLSRVMSMVTSTEHQQVAQWMREMHSLYVQNSDLINVGAYVAGANHRLDLAVKCHGRIVEFMKQGVNESMHLPETVEKLRDLCREGGI